MSRLALKEGSLFGEKYLVVRCIASGGMGAVYEVEHTQTERRRALKVMLPELIHDENMRNRFQLEAKVAAHIESDFIVDVVDAGIDETTGFPFLVMELLRGEDLRSRVQRSGPLPPHEVVHYLYQTALALDKTHRASIVHRDLKPENLFLSNRDDGMPLIKILDFGIAKIVAETSTHSNFTREIMGTPLYMSPEQFDVSQRVTAATDIYALGMIAFTLLTGKAYWADQLRTGANLYAFMGCVKSGIPEPATARATRYNVILPPALDAWFAQMTALLPAERFESATAAILALADALNVPRPTRTGPSHPPPITPLVMPGAVTATSAATTLLRTHPTQSSPRRTWGIILATCLGIGVPAIIYGNIRLNRPEREEASSGTSSAQVAPQEANSKETASSAATPSNSAPLGISPTFGKPADSAPVPGEISGISEPSPGNTIQPPKTTPAQSQQRKIPTNHVKTPIQPTQTDPPITMD